MLHHQVQVQIQFPVLGLPFERGGRGPESLLGSQVTLLTRQQSETKNSGCGASSQHTTHGCWSAGRMPCNAVGPGHLPWHKKNLDSPTLISPWLGTISTCRETEKDKVQFKHTFTFLRTKPRAFIQNWRLEQREMAVWVLRTGHHHRFHGSSCRFQAWTWSDHSLWHCCLCLLVPGALGGRG